VQPRVFVSSVMEGFTDNREAARAAIIAAGGEPVLIEDQAGLPHSPRNACLDAVASCDISLIIVGERGGYVAPSGKLVVEEEFEEAKRRKLPILILILSGHKDEMATAFIKKVSDYVEGFYRKTVTGPDDLKKIAIESLQPVIKSWGRLKVDLSMIEEHLIIRGNRDRNEPNLRFVLCPERIDELVDPVTLGTDEFKEEVLEIGHSAKVKLFSYEESKSTDVEVDKIIVSQGEERRRGQAGIVRVEITTHGLMIIDVGLSRPANNTHEYLNSMVVLESDVTSALKRCFAFAAAFFQHKDAYRRYERMHYNVLLDGMGYRAFMKEMPKGNSISMPMGGNEPVKVFDISRPLVRANLLAPEKEIETVLVLCIRRLKK